jgi:RHS repeat-associated protein
MGMGPSFLARLRTSAREGLLSARSPSAHPGHFARKPGPCIGSVVLATVIAGSSGTLAALAPASLVGATPLPAPTITAVSPPTGSTAAGGLVTLTGTNLQGATAVDFGTTAGTTVVVTGATDLTVKAPAHSPGMVTVTVTTPGGTSGAGEHFVYDPVPQLSGGESPCSSGISSSSKFGPGSSGDSSVSHAGCVLSVYDGTSWSKPVDPFVDDGEYNDYATSGGQECASSTECAVVSADGYVAVYSGSSWSTATDPFAPGDGVVKELSCPFAGACVAISNDGYASTLSGTQWSSPIEPFSSLGARTDTTLGACQSAIACYAIGHSSTTGGFSSSFFDGSTWSTPVAIPYGGNYLIQVTCVSSAFCVAQSNDGSLIFYNGTAWSPSQATPFPPSDDTAGTVTCLSASFCYDVGRDGGLATYDESTEIQESDPFLADGNSIDQAICYSATLCWAGSHGIYGGGYEGSLDAYFNGTSWTSIDEAPATCLSSTLCYNGYTGTTKGDNLLTYTGTTWVKDDPSFTTNGDGITSTLECLSVSWCYAKSYDGFVSDFNGTSWSAPVNPFASDGSESDEVGTFNCLTSSFCDATSYDGYLSYFNGTSWSAPVNPFTSDGSGSDETSSATCLTASFCAATSEHGFVSTFNGSSWSTPVNPIIVGGVTGQLTSLPCQAVGACVAVGGVSPWLHPYGTALSALESGDPSAPGCGCIGPQAKVGDPVNTATGGFTTTTTDLSVAGAGVPLALTSSYRSLLAQDQVSNDLSPGALGYGWSDNLGMSISLDTESGAATVTEEDGAQITFAPYSAQTSPWWCTPTVDYCPTAPRSIATLNHNADGTWTFVRTLQGTTTFQFNAAGELDEVADAAGDSISASTGTPGSGQCPASAASCTVWTSSLTARTITLVFNGTGQLLEAVDEAGNTTSFCAFGQSCAPSSGGQSGDLASITRWSGTPAAETTEFTYDSTNADAALQHDMLTDVPPGGGPGDETTNTYGSGGRVTAQSTPGGAQYTFAYSGSSYAEDNGSADGGSTTVVSYPNGTGSGEPSTTDVYDYVDGTLQTENVDTTGIDKTESYVRDLTTLIPTSVTDLEGNTSSATVGGTNGTSPPSGDVTSSTDATGNTTLYAYTADNLLYCTVKPAEVQNGVSCPTSPPASPPAPGAADPDLGATISFYNDSDQLTATTDALGNTTTYAYTPAGHGVPAGLQYCSVDPVGYQKAVACPAYGATHVGGTTTETFDAAGDVVTTTDPDGASTTDAYGTSGHPGLVSSTTDPDRTKTTYTYDAAGQVSEQVVSFHSYSATTKNAYDSEGRLYCTVAPSESVKGVTCPATPPSSPPTGTPGYTDTIYNAQGEVTSTTSPIGGTTQYAYDGSGNRYCTVAPSEYAKGKRCPSSPPSSPPTITTDPYLGMTIDTFDALGHEVQETNPLGGITLDTYDPDGNLTETQVESDSSSDPTVTTDYTYDADNQVTSTTVDPGSSSPSITEERYDPNGSVFCSVSADAYAAGSSAFQCPTWQSGWAAQPPNPTSLYSSSPDPAQADNVTTTFDNAAGQQVQTTTADKGSTVTAYDATGDPYCSSAPADLANWLATHSTATYPYLCPATPPTSAPTGVTGYTTTLYDASGNVTSVTTPTGATTATAYDAAGNKASVTTGGATTTYCYYADSCASGAPKAGGAGAELYTTTLPPSTADPTGEVTTDTYTKTGQVKTETTPALTTTYDYDDAGDVTSIDYSGVAAGYGAPADVTETYTSTGTPVKVTTGEGRTTDTYNAAGDVVTSAFTPATGSGLSASSLGYAYYPTGKQKSIAYPSYGSHATPKVTYKYSKSGAMANITDWLGHTIDVTDDPDGNVASIAYPNGTTDSVTSDLTNETTGISLAPTAHPTAPVAAIAYTRDATEQVTNEDDTGALSATPSYTYDDSARLSTTGTHSVAYTTASEPETLPTGASATYNDAGQLTGATLSGTTTTDSYDSIGARTTVTPGTGPTTTYGYDALGQLTSATSSAATGPLSGTGVQFAYDATGLRVGETANTATTTTMVWDAATTTPEILSEGTGGFAHGDDFVYGPNGEVVEQVDLATTTPTYLVRDQLGSTRLLTNETGTVVGTSTYDAYGNQTSHTGTATTPIGYAGGWATAATGLIYLVNRYYTPTTASFLSVDPDVATTTAPYVYATDDPVYRRDPSGLGCTIDPLTWVTCGEDVVGAAEAIVAAAGAVVEEGAAIAVAIPVAIGVAVGTAAGFAWSALSATKAGGKAKVPIYFGQPRISPSFTTTGPPITGPSLGFAIGIFAGESHGKPVAVAINNRTLANYSINDIEDPPVIWRYPTQRELKRLTTTPPLPPQTSLPSPLITVTPSQSCKTTPVDIHGSDNGIVESKSFAEISF